MSTHLPLSEYSKIITQFAKKLAYKDNFDDLYQEGMLAVYANFDAKKNDNQEKYLQSCAWHAMIAYNKKSSKNSYFSIVFNKFNNKAVDKLKKNYFVIPPILKLPLSLRSVCKNTAN